MSPIRDRVTPGCPAWCTRTGDHVTHSRSARLGDASVTVTIYETEPHPRVASGVWVWVSDLDGEGVHLAPGEARELGRLLAGRDPALSRELVAAADLAESGAR